MKNLMKAPMSSTTDSWPSKNPCVKERLEGKLRLALDHLLARGFRLDIRGLRRNRDGQLSWETKVSVGSQCKL